MRHRDIQTPPDELLESLRDSLDDIDRVWILQTGQVKKRNANGSTEVIGDIGAIIHFLDGGSTALHTTDADLLLQSNVLTRLRIPIRRIVAEEVDSCDD